MNRGRMSENQLKFIMQPTIQREASSRLHGLDALRAFAILGVLAFHYHRNWDHPKWMENVLFKFGWSGVDLFFVLSGFLISSQLFQELTSTSKISFKSFYLKRSFRILPNYWFVLGLYFLFPSVREVPENTPWLKLLTFTQNLGFSDSSFSHAWSLCIEEHFYFLLPITLLLMAKWNGLKHIPVIVTFALMLGFIWKCWFMNWLMNAPAGQDKLYLYNLWLYRPTFSRLDGLLTGFLIAWIYHYASGLRAWMTQRHLWCLCGGILLLVGNSVLESHRQSVPYGVMLGLGGRYTFVSIAFGLILISAITPGSIMDRLRWKPVAMFATYSYAIYLSHKIGILTTQRLLGSAGVNTENNLTVLICIATSFLAGMAMHYGIERPSHALRQKTLAWLHRS